MTVVAGELLQAQTRLLVDVAALGVALIDSFLKLELAGFQGVVFRRLLFLLQLICGIIIILISHPVCLLLLDPLIDIEVLDIQMRF